MSAESERADYDDLQERWREGGLSADEEQTLMEWLKSNPQHMQQFVTANIRQQMLCDVARGELLADEARVIAAPLPTTLLRRQLAMAAAAICAVAALLMLWPRGNPPVAPDRPNAVSPTAPAAAFASITFVNSPDCLLATGDRLSDQTVAFETGVVRLVFDDGVEVTLQGPVRYELISAERTHLHTGLLTATVPAGAQGFRVDTPSAQVVDLGTAFGVQQQQGTSQVVVFDGEVEVTRGDQTRRLTEGDTVQLTSAGDISETEFATEPFEKLWPAASGITASTGAFEFAPQWPRLNRVESDDLIFVRPEGYAQSLQEDCPIDLTPGKTAGTSLATSVIPRSTRVRSFLLQFNPVDGSGPPLGSGPQLGNGPPRGNGPLQGNRRNGRRISGSITFERPILGLIVHKDTLTKTDTLFSQQQAGRHRTGRMPGRGLELQPPRIADRVQLSEDRRTLTLDLFVVDRLSDHVRVIVDAALYQDTTLAGLMVPARPSETSTLR